LLPHFGVDGRIRNLLLVPPADGACDRLGGSPIESKKRLRPVDPVTADSFAEIRWAELIVDVEESAYMTVLLRRVSGHVLHDDDMELSAGDIPAHVLELPQITTSIEV
jgi:hypothetical protein